MASQALDFLQGDWVNVENRSETYEVTGRTVRRSSPKQGDRSFPDILVWEEKWQKLYWGPKGRYYLESPIPQGDKISWLAWGTGKGFQWERRKDGGTHDKQSKDQYGAWSGGRSTGDDWKVAKEKEHKAKDYWERDQRDGEQSHSKDYWERGSWDEDKTHKDKNYWGRDNRDQEKDHKDKDYWGRDHRDKASSSSPWVAHSSSEQPKDSSSSAGETINGSSKAEGPPGEASGASRPPRNYLGVEPGREDHERLIARSLLADGFRPKPDQEDAEAPPAKRAKEESSFAEL
eukprot:TRINITY_DN29819_c0_g2_i1.p1 TRINITY_DN29819_c0_g2~~TRINITY_DN29819_c0_g2_i1.p1  ORF type:complete len:289 (-),score=69.37 TRINITY_DN29819_c0_g2_i1:13-879(-)